jgi:hypothetical protein
VSISLIETGRVVGVVRANAEPASVRTTDSLHPLKGAFQWRGAGFGRNPLTFVTGDLRGIARLFEISIGYGAPTAIA